MTLTQSLNQQLTELGQELQSKLPSEVVNIMTREAENLARQNMTQHSVRVGDTIPLFTLPNATGKQVSIARLLAQGPLVISFYRGAWCPYCNLELKTLQDTLPQIKKLGASLVAISPQLPDKSLSLKEKLALDFDVLSDKGNRVAQTFGLSFTPSTVLQEVYDNLGLDIPQHNGDDSYELPMAATYVVSQKGEITYAHVDSDYTKRAEPSELIEALKELQPVEACSCALG